MIQIAFQAMLNQLVVRNNPAAKLFGVVVAGMAGESGSGSQCEKDNGGERALQGNLRHCCNPIVYGWPRRLEKVVAMSVL
ncbi:MAG: hypothetical protein ACLPSF_05795 [Methylocella sp.]